jgi:hypothetical protein
LSIKLKVHKTDTRFNLHRFGFTHYIEFQNTDWNEYATVTTYCRKQFGDEFWHFNGKVYAEGNWKGVYRHKIKHHETKRIFFKGEKYITLLRMVLPEDSYTYYL